MLETPLSYSARKAADMEDLELLGELAFDLEINSKQEIKEAFIRLVSLLGTERFIEEYLVLYNAIREVSEEKRRIAAYEDIAGIEFVGEGDGMFREIGTNEIDKFLSR
jgi:hypothetical protein